MLFFHKNGNCIFFPFHIRDTTYVVCDPSDRWEMIFHDTSSIMERNQRGLNSRMNDSFLIREITTIVNTVVKLRSFLCDDFKTILEFGNAPKILWIAEKLWSHCSHECAEMNSPRIVNKVFLRELSLKKINFDSSIFPSHKKFQEWILSREERETWKSFWNAHSRATQVSECSCCCWAVLFHTPSMTLH